MSKDKIHKCSECGNKLTQYEIADNIYANISEKNYICYSCQSDIEETENDDDERTPYEDTW